MRFVSHEHSVIAVRSARQATWAVRRAFEMQRPLVDVHLTGNRWRVSRTLEALDASATAHGAFLIRSPGGHANRRRVTLRLPPKPSSGPGGDPAGDREPRRPKPPAPSVARRIPRDS